MSVRLGWVNADRLTKELSRLVRLLRRGQNNPEIQVRDADLRIQRERPLQMCFRGFLAIGMHLRVSQIRQRLRVLGLRLQLRFELVASVLVALLLPVEIAQPEVSVGRRRRYS